MPNTVYYAVIDKVEDDEKRWFFEFHCLEQGFTDGILGLPIKDFFNGIRENRDQVITLNNTAARIRQYFAVEDFLDTESTWVTLHTNTSEEGLPGQLFVEGNDGPAPIYINGIDPMEPRDPTRLLLEEQVSLATFPDASERELLDTLEGSNLSFAEFASVYNVGQGNCNAICDYGCKPMLYFDLGGGCYANKHTYPTCLSYCFTNKPSILLSHWDTDHYQSAKMNIAYQSKDWVVPRQKIGPVHLKFFLALSGKKLIWPSLLPQLTIRWGKVILCNGPSGKKNHTGLAFWVSLPATVGGIKEVLLPADAAYTYIPGISSLTFDGLVATHHGANFDHGNAPVISPNGVNAIAYSYGSTNTYSHPKSTAVAAHVNAGWTSLSKDTSNGHIAFINGPLPPLACNASACNLKITQHF